MEKFRCGHCGGTGFIPYGARCPMCKGSGTRGAR